MSTEIETPRPEKNLPPVMREMRDDDDSSLREWLDGLVGDGAVRVTISRKKPQVGPNGENVAGNLETVEERIDEDYIREHWGGGDFQLKIFRPNASGNWMYFRARSIKIAGPAKMNGVLLMAGGNVQAVAHAEEPLAEKAFQAMERNVQYERDRAARVERESRSNGNGIDMAAIQALNAPLYDQIRAAQEMVSSLQAKVLDNATRPPPKDEFRDRMMERMMDGESSRLSSLRERFDSEMRQARENHLEEVRRLHERHNDELKTQEKRHEREIDLVQRMVDSEGRAKEVAYGTRTDGLKAEVDRLNRELTEARARIGSLEQRKDQSITDKADELLKIREALSGLGGGGDEKDSSWYEKVIGAVGNSEVALNLLNKLGGPGAQEQQAQLQPGPQQMLPPPGVPFQAPDGHIYVRDHAGNVEMVDPNVVRQQRALAAARKKKRANVAQADGTIGEPTAEGVVAEAAAPAAEPPRPPNPSEVKIAVQFMESAINNGTDPAAFGATARSLIPGDILSYIRQVGIDEFLNKVAKLENGSPLTTQKGRNFARGVARYLLEGTTEGA